MIKKCCLLQIHLIIILFASLGWSADKIHGSACYTYGDNESLVQAEQMTKTLAIRNAIESYSIFIESTTQVKDFQLSSDLTNMISNGHVKCIKVLKHFQVGRKICLTVEGYVEPYELKNAVNRYLKGNDMGADVRLQENEWIRIVDQFVTEETGEQFYTSRDLDVPPLEKDKKIKTLYVKIMFLKPCIATTLNPDYTKTYKKDDFSWMSDFFDDSMPAFRCDPKIKVFISFYSSSGSEIKTMGIVPFISVGMRAKDPEWRNKKELLPGETFYVWSTMLPDTEDSKAEYWKVWVPK